MTRIATNHCLNVIRGKKAPWHEKYRVRIETMSGSVDGGFSFVEHKELLHLVLCRVVERDAQLAELATYAFVDDMRQQDICALVGMSAPTLRKRLREFIAIARDELSTDACPRHHLCRSPHLTRGHDAPSPRAPARPVR
jgi:DNA-directed RNA polymerase specialized sigma24 family protein